MTRVFMLHCFELFSRVSRSFNVSNTALLGKLKKQHSPANLVASAPRCGHPKQAEAAGCQLTMGQKITTLQLMGVLSHHYIAL